MKHLQQFFLIAILTWFSAHPAISQSGFGTITGTVLSDQGNPLPGAYIFVNTFTQGTVTDSAGVFTHKVPSGTPIKLYITYVGYDTAYAEYTLKQGEILKLQFTLDFNTQEMKAVVIKGNRRFESGLTPLKSAGVTKIAGPSSSIEKTLIFQGQGVSSRNEMSSQYSVRGGNFDENLVYVNGIQIYRPFLVRSGRQEGLSFVNPSMVSNVNFSAGGFESRFGDKMSSVLDVTYKEPEKFAAFVEGSFLGAQLALEHASDDKRFTQIHGFRYRTNQYILNSLDTEGQYKPQFMDYQGYLTFDVSDRVEIGFLGSFASNKFEFEPETRRTEFGTFNESLQLTVGYDGHEVNQYQTAMGALSLSAFVTDSLLLKFSVAANNSYETETFDIESAYRLDELDKDLGSDNFGQVAFNRGIGGMIEHARNYYQSTIYAFNHDAKWYRKNNEFSWGVRATYEITDDEYKEWEYLDSLDYSTPQEPKSEIVLNESYAAKNNLDWYRLNGYLQWDRTFELDSNLLHINLGGRLNYMSYTNEWVGGPRIIASFKPNWIKNYRFKAAFGYYHQPPTYREMRSFTGEVNPDIRAQTSIHYILGFENDFQMWNRPFKITTEAYYKDLQNLIPYQMENVRIRYYATNNSEGYTTGIDFKINGEFVKGVESWASVSLMQTEEDLRGDFYYKYYDANGNETYPGNPYNPVVSEEKIEPGYVPRPTDQRMSFAIFFQDYLKDNPTFKVNLTAYFSTGLPFGPPDYQKHTDVYRMPPYNRVDVGFSKELLQNKFEKRNKLGNMGGFKKMKSMWLAFEIFNMLGVRNTISYTWVRDSQNRQFAVPNHLTNRQVNLKLQFRF